MPTETGRPIVLYLTPSEYQTLKEAAEKSRKSMALMAKRIVFEKLNQEHLTSEEKPLPESEHSETQSAVLSTTMQYVQDRTEQLSLEVARLERDVAETMRRLQSVESSLKEAKHVKPKRQGQSLAAQHQME